MVFMVSAVICIGLSISYSVLQLVYNCVIVLLYFCVYNRNQILMIMSLTRLMKKMDLLMILFFHLTGMYGNHEPHSTHWSLCVHKNKTV